MRATLIYNPQAGKTSKLTPEDILKALQQVGYESNYIPTSVEKDLDAVLLD